MTLTETTQANLRSISLAQLLAGNADAENDLLLACKEIGFFYLDIRHPSTSNILTYVEKLTKVGKAVFALPLEEKEEYSTEKYLPSRLLGYKRAGCSVGPFSGKKDGYESFSVHNNAIFGDDAMVVPAQIETNLSLFKDFMNEAHNYTDCILTALSKGLSLSNNLKDCNRRDKPSSANMAMLSYLPWGSNDEQVGNMAHTDMGTLTVVFTQSDGLQTLLPGDNTWSFIPPRPGCAVVNVGDSLRFMTNGALRSSLHRVVPPNSAEQDKFSVIYFLRPEMDAKFKTHDGREINSIEWHNEKYALFREEALDAKQHGAMLTGRAEYLGATHS